MHPDYKCSKMQQRGHLQVFVLLTLVGMTVYALFLYQGASKQLQGFKLDLRKAHLTKKILEQTLSGIIISQWCAFVVDVECSQQAVGPLACFVARCKASFG